MLYLKKPNKDPAMLGVSPHARKERDLYSTIDKNVTRAFIRRAFFQNLLNHKMVVWECACGDWSMGEVLDGAFADVIGSDIVPLHERGFTHNFLGEDVEHPFDAIVTNPPFGDDLDLFIARGLRYVREKGRVFAIVARNEIDSAGTRRKFFGKCPEYAAKISLTFRPRWIADTKGGPRHNYAWFVWRPTPQNLGSRIYYEGRHH